MAFFAFFFECKRMFFENLLINILNYLYRDRRAAKFNVSWSVMRKRSHANDYMFLDCIPNAPTRCWNENSSARQGSRIVSPSWMILAADGSVGSGSTKRLELSALSTCFNIITMLRSFECVYTVWHSLYNACHVHVNKHVNILLAFSVTLGYRSVTLNA